MCGVCQAASPRWEPQIAVLCEAGQVYQPQYLSEEGRWVTDLNKKSSGTTCLRDKLDLLDYCKKLINEMKNDSWKHNDGQVDNNFNDILSLMTLLLKASNVTSIDGE
uniref:E1 domain-containing protein n=1 Tax=Glossina brevipalpis TaxID=37001 RepID=A0A1A9W633_9MUSC